MEEDEALLFHRRLQARGNRKAFGVHVLMKDYGKNVFSTFVDASVIEARLHSLTTILGLMAST